MLFGGLFWLAGKCATPWVLQPYLWIFFGFGLFILACGRNPLDGDRYHMVAGLSAVCCDQDRVRGDICFNGCTIAKATPLGGSILLVIDSLASKESAREY